MTSHAPAGRSAVQRHALTAAVVSFHSVVAFGDDGIMLLLLLTAVVSFHPFVASAGPSQSPDPPSGTAGRTT